MIRTSGVLYKGYARGCIVCEFYEIVSLRFRVIFLKEINKKSFLLWIALCS